MKILRLKSVLKSFWEFLLLFQYKENLFNCIFLGIRSSSYFMIFLLNRSFLASTAQILSQRFNERLQKSSRVSRSASRVAIWPFKKLKFVRRTQESLIWIWYLFGLLKLLATLICANPKITLFGSKALKDFGTCKV